MWLVIGDRVRNKETGMIGTVIRSWNHNGGYHIRWSNNDELFHWKYHVDFPNLEIISEKEYCAICALREIDVIEN